MKRDFMILSESWQPSTFYDGKTKLTWVMKYDLFVKIHERKIRGGNGVAYAIHKDVYDAFLHMYKTKPQNGGKRKRRTRKKYRK